ncbi:MAG: FecR domain-containing protein [Elusimicrobiales bacterium]|nr:FecR domain-containing protein [Elusimicrobiales bacterium]
MRTLKLLAVLVLAAAPRGAAPSGAAPQEMLLVPEGQVEARPSKAAAWIKVNETVRVRPGAEIRTAKDSKAGVVLSDGTRFQLANNSLFGVEETTRKKAGFRLMAGKLKAAVAGYFSSRFEVRTPAAVCAVRGTEFEIEVGKDGATEMNVSEGLVEVNDSKGKTAVVSSEERIKIGMDGMSRPEMVSLKDERAGQAARPMAVRLESARERTRTMLEELRNRELKANEAQLGKDSVDAFGRRVRLEEYLLRPADDEFKILFLSRRAESDRLDWGHLIERFNSDIPDDISQVGAIIDGMYLSATAPSNWMKYFEVYMTNTVDSIKETIDFTAPVAINFAGYNGGVAATRYYPGSIDYKQILSGPGVPGGERTQFQQIQDYNSTTAGQFTWTQKVVNNAGTLTTLEQITLDPTNVTDVSDGYTAALVDKAGIYGGSIDATVNPSDPVVSYPSGPGKADYSVGTTYADGSTVVSRKILVSNDGEVLGIPGNPNSATFLAEGSFNLELVVESSLFQGRNIDVLFAPEILTQKRDATTTADSFTLD